MEEGLTNGPQDAEQRLKLLKEKLKQTKTKFDRVSLENEVKQLALKVIRSKLDARKQTKLPVRTNLDPPCKPHLANLVPTSRPGLFSLAEEVQEKTDKGQTARMTFASKFKSFTEGFQQGKATTAPMISTAAPLISPETSDSEEVDVETRKRQPWRALSLITPRTQQAFEEREEWNEWWKDRLSEDKRTTEAVDSDVPSDSGYESCESAPCQLRGILKRSGSFEDRQAKGSITSRSFNSERKISRRIVRFNRVTSKRKPRKLKNTLKKKNPSTDAGVRRREAFLEKFKATIQK